MFSAATALLCTAGLLTACSSGPDTAAAPPPATASPAPTTTSAAASPTIDPAADAKSQVLAAYTGMWAEQVKAFAKGSTDGTDLERFTTDKALGDVRISVVKFGGLGIVFTGAPAHTPQVETIDIAATPRTATVRDCLDVTAWKPVDKASGQEKKVTNRLRYVIVYSARTVGTDWKMTDVTRHQDQAC
ncbi:hypothetical protein ACIOJE_27600 [Kitasatospora sp. NPDC087861]|uniref:hypothetical protein n=1 Tax=Kitasatospora sp. NPDC087861 TaxID=3364070 RepID=UPI00382382F4